MTWRFMMKSDHFEDCRQRRQPGERRGLHLFMQGYGERLSSPCRQQCNVLEAVNSRLDALQALNKDVRALMTVLTVELPERAHVYVRMLGVSRVASRVLRFLIISEVSLTGDTLKTVQNHPASLTASGFKGF